jgi:hypothetical protein
MPDCGRRTRPWNGFCVVIAASAIAGMIGMASRPDFEPTDVLIPVAVGAISVGALAMVRELGPEPVRAVASDQRFLIGFTVVLSAALVIWALLTLG